MCRRIMGLFLSLDHKCMVICITCGLTLLVSGGVFFLISAGLPDPAWLVLGAVGLGVGLVLLISGIILWLSAIRWWTVEGDSRTSAAAREETETFNMCTSDMA